MWVAGSLLGSAASLVMVAMLVAAWAGDGDGAWADLQDPGAAAGLNGAAGDPTAVADARGSGPGVEGGGAADADCGDGRCRDPRYSDSHEYLYGAGRADPPEGRFVDVAVWAYGSCGVRDSGELVCWGDHWSAAPEGRFTKVSMSGSHGCALAVNGSVECWGDNDSGQIDAPQGEFVEVSVSGSRSCAVALDASVRCWGADADLAIPAGDFAKVYADSLCGLRTDGEYVCWGQDGRYGALLDAPESEFEALSMELGYACALSTDGEVSCWGSSANFEGDSPPAAAADGPFVSLSVGYGHACALAADGSVECWGNNDAGQAEPRQGPFVQVTAGREFTCALDAAGEVSCWGHGSTDRRARALRRISAGHNFLCGILASDATVSCWPQRTGGGLLEDELLEDEPRGGGYVDVDAGRDYACALKADGQAVCWGYRDDLWEVFAFASEQRYRAIAVGYRAACGLRTDGTGHCWIPDWHPPGPGGQFAHVAAGPCGIRPTRNIECWGFTEHRRRAPRQHRAAHRRRHWLANLLRDKGYKLSHRLLGPRDQPPTIRDRGLLLPDLHGTLKNLRAHNQQRTAVLVPGPAGPRCTSANPATAGTARASRASTCRKEHSPRSQSGADTPAPSAPTERSPAGAATSTTVFGSRVPTSPTSRMYQPFGGGHGPCSLPLPSLSLSPWSPQRYSAPGAAAPAGATIPSSPPASPTPKPPSAPWTA